MGGKLRKEVVGEVGRQEGGELGKEVVGEVGRQEGVKSEQNVHTLT